MCKSRTAVFKEYTREYKWVISVVLCFQSGLFLALAGLLFQGFESVLY